MQRFVVAIDQGTSSTRVVLYDLQLRAVKTASRPLVPRAPQPGWLEMDGQDILASVDACLAEACEGLAPGQVVCAGLTNQRETTLALDTETGLALSPAILWSDTRTADICGEWRSDAEWAARLTQRTGLPVSPYFSASKMAWLLRHQPGVAEARRAGRLAFATVDAFVLRHLTGRLATDGSNASRTLLMDLAALRYDPELVAHLGLAGCALPEILPSTGLFGRVASGALAGTPVTAVLGDQQAALLGQGCLAPGDAKATFGTGCFLLQHAGTRPPTAECAAAGLVATVALQTGPAAATYAAEGSVAAAGSVVTWLRDQLGLIGSYEQLDEEAGKVEDCGGVTVVPAFGGLLAPHWRSDARAAVLGLSLGSSRAHLVRACLAGVAQSVADVAEAMGGAEGAPLRVDGGLAASRVLIQLVADCTGREVGGKKVCCLLKRDRCGCARSARRRRWERRWQRGRGRGCGRWRKKAAPCPPPGTPSCRASPTLSDSTCAATGKRISSSALTSKGQ